MPQYVALLASILFFSSFRVLCFFCIFIAARRIVNYVNAIAMREKHEDDDNDDVKIRICGSQKINISYVFMYLWIGPEQCEIFVILSWHHIKDRRKKNRSEEPSYRADSMSMCMRNANVDGWRVQCIESERLCMCSPTPIQT